MEQNQPETLELHALQTFGQIKQLHPLTFERAAEIIQSGLTINMVEDFLIVTELDITDLCFVLNITGDGFREWRDARIFPVEASNTILQLADIYAFGYDLFSQRRTFNGWMKECNQALGDIPPFSLLCNAHGLQEVLSVLKRIDHFML